MEYDSKRIPVIFSNWTVFSRITRFWKHVHFRTEDREGSFGNYGTEQSANVLQGIQCSPSRLLLRDVIYTTKLGGMGRA